MTAPLEHARTAFRLRGPDRRRERRFILVDRRSGFERRRDVHRSRIAAVLDAPVLRLRDQPVVLAEVLVLINLFSVLDLLITMTVLRMGAIEVNPVMAWLLEVGPGPAALAKIGVVALATLGLWFLRRRRKALTAALLILGTYGALVAYELIGVLRLL